MPISALLGLSHKDMGLTGVEWYLDPLHYLLLKELFTKATVYQQMYTKLQKSISGSFDENTDRARIQIISLNLFFWLGMPSSPITHILGKKRLPIFRNFVYLLTFAFFTSKTPRIWEFMNWRRFFSINKKSSNNNYVIIFGRQYSKILHKSTVRV